MTQEQIAWAQTQPWFNKDNKDGTIIVQGMFDGVLYETLGTFGSIEALKNWAAKQVS